MNQAARHMRRLKIEKQRSEKNGVKLRCIRVRRKDMGVWGILKESFIRG